MERAQSAMNRQLVAHGERKNAVVGIVRLPKPVYPTECPYHPSETYPEYPFGQHVSSAPNFVYTGLRRLFHVLRLDETNYGTRQWNPLGSLIQPGMKVIIKPNFVLSRHFDGKDVFSIITHPSVLRAVADFCWVALKGEGNIIIADAPQYNCNFNELLEITKLDSLCEFYGGFRGPKVAYRDLRDYWSAARHFPSMIRPLPGDPEGTIRINLGRESALYDHPNPRGLYGAVYHRHETIQHHTGETQIYELSSTIMNADVVISVPKMKVHKKVGVTLNMKGLVGMATNKNLIVHYTLGTPSEGGDQFPEGVLSRKERGLIKLERWMYDHLLAKRKVPLEYLHRTVYWLHGWVSRPLGVTVDDHKRLLDAGNWYGNDSAWRMVVDLVRILYFLGRDGKVHNTPQRRLFSIIDGVIGGENVGPLVPDPKPVGILVGGDNLVAVDLVTTRLMGFDYRKIKMFSILQDPKYDLGVREFEDIQVSCEEEELRSCVRNKKNRYFAFTPHPGWIEHIEI